MLECALASAGNADVHSLTMIIPCALSPTTGVSDDGSTVVVTAGVVGSTAASIGADDRSVIVEEAGSVGAAGEISDSVAADGGAKGVTASGVVVASATTVCTGVPPTGWIVGAGDATEDMGLGDERAVVGDRVVAGIYFRGSVSSLRRRKGQLLYRQCEELGATRMVFCFSPSPDSYRVLLIGIQV